MSRLASSAALALVLGACGGAVAPEPEAEAGATKVTCAAVVAHATRDGLLVRGTVAPVPEREARVAAQLSGVVLSVDVRVGDRVEVGQAVAHLDTGAFAAVERAADAALASAVAERRNATTSLARSSKVVAGGMAPPQELDDARTRLALAEAGERAARTALAEAKRQALHTTVTSPLAGVVLEVMVKAGDVLDTTIGASSTAIASVADLAALELVADATAADLARMAVGQPATVLLAGGSQGRSGADDEQPIEGHVVMVAPAIDRATGLGQVRIALTLPAGLMAPVIQIGAFGSARVLVGAERSGLFVPAVAVTRAPSGGAQVALCGSRVALIPVAVIATVAGASEVVAETAGALAAGARVVVEPALGLDDGTLIEEVEDNGAGDDTGADARPTGTKATP